MRKINRTLCPVFLIVALVALTPAVWSAQTLKRQKPLRPTTGRKPSRDESRADIPKHPKDLKYAAFDYQPPRREDYRHILSNGAVAYLVEDHDLPLINVSIFIRTGSYLEPAGKEGLASLTASQMRGGGTTSMTAEEFDEAIDFLAADIASDSGDTIGGANLNCLSIDFDRALGLYVSMLKNPGFQANRLAIAKNQLIQQMERRNDSTDIIESREWSRLLRGADHFSTKQATKDSIESITRNDLLAFHGRYYHPAAFVFAVAGDFNTTEMLAKLETSLKGWESSKATLPQVPKPTHAPVAGIYTVNKTGVDQGRVSIGHVGSMRDNPDSYALTIMNDILGGGGFTSRITSRVRSDEGLAYEAASSYGFGVDYPSYFRTTFQSKSASTVKAIEIVLEEINHIRTAKVSDEELQTAKNSAIETLPLSFSNATQTSMMFALDEYTRRPFNYWDTYRERLNAVTADDVLRVAQKYLQPDQLVILVVGTIDDIMKSPSNKSQTTLVKFSPVGQIHQIPLPDPLTLHYPKLR